MTAIYNNFKNLLFTSNINVDTDTIKLALINDSISYTPDIDNEQYVSDVLDGVTANEFSDASYSRKLVDASVTQDNTTDTITIDAPDLVFSALEGDTIQSAILFRENTDDTDSELIMHLTSSKFPLPTNTGDVTVEVDANGLLTLT